MAVYVQHSQQEYCQEWLESVDADSRLLWMRLNTTHKQALRVSDKMWRNSFCVQEFMCYVKEAKPPAGHFPPYGDLNSFSWLLLASPLPSHTRAPIDAHYPSSTAASTWTDSLQLHNDDKSHKHCQRHSDSKKHPLKINPEHIASSFKHPQPFT